MYKIGENKIELCEFVENDPDFEMYYSWLRDYESIRLIGRREYLLTIDEKTVNDYVRGLNSSPNDAFFKVLYDGYFVGTFKIGHINWESLTADIGIMIGDKTVRGKGISSAVMNVGMRYAFEKLGMRKLVGGCVSVNEPMIKCFERSGFIREGCIRRSWYVEGEWFDHLFFGIFKDEFKNSSV